MARGRTAPHPVDVVAAHHTGTTRANVPTDELRAWVSDDQGRGLGTIILFPHGPHLDPQVIWKGKDDPRVLAVLARVVPGARIDRDGLNADGD